MLPSAGRSEGSPVALPRSFYEIQAGPAGGAVWQGRIPNTRLPDGWRPTLVYLPPSVSSRQRYPVVYLLQGFPGSPYEYAYGLQLANLADELVAAHQLPPFIAVIPPAGLTPRFRGESTGVWEGYLVRDVIPWIDTHLPASGETADRTVAGLSAGGYGAVDIALRHPHLFGTAESWSGYFTAPPDGLPPGAGATQLAAHDPSRLVVREAPLLRGLGTRFFLSSGTTHDRSSARAARSFAGQLSSFGIPHDSGSAPAGTTAVFGRRSCPRLFATHSAPAPSPAGPDGPDLGTRSTRERESRPSSRDPRHAESQVGCVSGDLPLRESSAATAPSVDCELPCGSRAAVSAGNGGRPRTSADSNRGQTRRRNPAVRAELRLVRQRRGWDSNPRDLSAQRFSRPPDSTALAPRRVVSHCEGGAPPAGRPP
jgi:enterochelin esterase-like enzyme